MIAMKILLKCPFEDFKHLANMLLLSALSSPMYFEVQCIKIAFTHTRGEGRGRRTMGRVDVIYVIAMGECKSNDARYLELKEKRE